MAKIQLGPMVGQASGAMGGTVFSRNRYGTYIRRRAHPTVSTTPAALAAKARLASVSQAWAGLTDAQREAFRVWAANNPVTDRLGERQVLSGHAAYTGLNSVLSGIGSSLITAPPTQDAPAALTSLSLTYDIGVGGVSLDFTATPLGANERLEIRACVVDSESVEYIENYLRLLMYSTAAAATGIDISTEMAARFGTISVGQVVHVQAAVVEDQSGLKSGPLRAEATVVST